MAAAAFVTDLTEILTQAIEAAAGLGSVYTEAKMLSVARDYYRLYDRQKQFYYQTFQYGIEAPLAQEVFAIPYLMLDYNKQIDTLINGDSGVFGGESTDAEGWWTRHARMYATNRDMRISELEPDMARLKSDWANYLFRFEEHYNDTMNDIRWNKRLAVHNVGLKQGTAVTAGLATAFSAYEDAMGRTGDMLATMANGAASYSGYRRGIADTTSRFDEANYEATQLVSNSGTVRNTPIVDGNRFVGPR